METSQGYKINNDELRHRGSIKLAYDLDEERGLNLGVDFVDEERGLSGLPEYPTPQSRKESRTTILSAQARGDEWTSSTFFQRR